MSKEKKVVISLSSSRIYNGVFKRHSTEDRFYLQNEKEKDYYNNHYQIGNKCKVDKS
jgi:hypothetical protein